MFQQNRSQENLLPHFKHLGSRYHPATGPVAEYKIRHLAMGVAWQRMGGFWHSAFSWAVERFVYTNHDVQAAISGLKSFVVPRTSMQELEKSHVAFLRSMVCGQAKSSTV